MKSKSHRFHPAALRTPAILAGIVMIATTGLSQAADFTWNVASGNWSTAASWLTGDPPAPGVPAATDNAIFSNNDTVGGLPVTIVLDGNKTINSMTFQSAGTTLFALGTNNRNLLLAGGLTIQSGAGAVTMSIATNTSGLNITADQSWTNDGTLTITNTLKPQTGPNTLTLNGTGTTNVSGTISGSLTLIKNGAGTLTLSGNNTFTGSLSINGGTLSITNHQQSHLQRCAGQERHSRNLG